MTLQEAYRSQNQIKEHRQEKKLVVSVPELTHLVRHLDLLYSELLKKIICLESQQLSYGKVRKNIFEENDIKFFNTAVAHIKKKYSKAIEEIPIKNTVSIVVVHEAGHISPKISKDFIWSNQITIN